MDMALANLLKHKIKFHYMGEVSRYGEKERHYMSMPIENKWSIDARYVHELCLKRLHPFIMHTISTIITEESDHINYIFIRAEVWDLSTGHRNGSYFDDRQDFMRINLRNPKFCIHLMSLNNQPTIYPFKEDVINHPFGISVKFSISTPRRIYRMTHPMEDESSDEHDVDDYDDDDVDEYTPPDETYRQDRCVICLENTPNILYLECKHIAVCDSCDRMKRTMALRSTCDICRVEISRRLKI